MEVIKKDEVTVGILWDVTPKLVDAGGNGMLVEMQWGWDSWTTPEDLERRAEDSPTGFDSVVMNIQQARELRDALTAIVDSPEAAIVTEEAAAVLASIEESSRNLNL